MTLFLRLRIARGGVDSLGSFCGLNGGAIEVLRVADVDEGEQRTDPAGGKAEPDTDPGARQQLA